MSLHVSLFTAKILTQKATLSLVTLHIIIIIYRYEVSLTGEPNLNVSKKDDKVSFTATQLNEETFYRFLVSPLTGSSDVCPGPVISLPVTTKPCPGMCYLFYTMISHIHKICTYIYIQYAHTAF